MAAFESYSHSPQAAGTVLPHVYAGNPLTPVHSPHHSIASSASRTPVHTLTIHEYRKQQHTPVISEGATPNKLLRRKPAAAALNNVERAPSAASHTRLGSGSSLRPLHFTQSASHLHASQFAHSPCALPNAFCRSQSVEPYAQSRSISSDSTANSLSKVRIFKTRKRLPRPPAATRLVLSPPPVERKSTRLRRSQLPAAASRFSSENARLSDTQTTPTPSTFSLSRFPQPPHHIDPSFSPPHDESELSSISALGYYSTAPATPPATPATIHYRGTSFDLVNPHDSLLLHEIVTPSREFDSSDYLGLRTPEEELFADSAEMAPRRALYGDLNAARAGILQGLEEAASNSNHEMPSAPTPTAVSPHSSSYTSPMYSPESVNAPSPLAIKRPTNASRFSLKQLTRSLSKKLGKSPAGEDDQELQVMSSEPAAPWKLSEYEYVSTPQASYFPGHSSPMRPAGPSEARHTYDTVYSSMLPVDAEVESPQKLERGSYVEEPLRSLIPDDPSTQVGRADGSHLSMLEDTASSKPYYDDLDSIYPSSSVYTGDGHRLSRYQQSLNSNRQSKSLRYSGMEASGYNGESFDGYNDIRRHSYQASRSVTQDFHHQSVDQGNTKTDTISKLIDDYRPAEVANNPSLDRLDQVVDQSPKRTTMASNYFDFSLRPTEDTRDGTGLFRMGSVQSRRPTITRDVGRPPQEALPLAPAFEYDEMPFIPPRMEESGILSNDSSYSYDDTCNLLQMRQSGLVLSNIQNQTLKPSSSYSQTGQGMMLEPSSSYSQEASKSPRAPQEALDEAEKIFQEAIEESKHEEEKIPAMWIRRSSGSQLLSKKMADRSSGVSYSDATSSARHSKGVATDKADWETIAGNSPDRRESLDSFADYSSSENSQNLEHEGDDLLPSWDPNHHQDSSNYNHQNPVRNHFPLEFASSPPKMNIPASPRTEPTLSASTPVSSPTGSRTAPILGFNDLPGQVRGLEAVNQPYVSAPWADPYALSDKETEELLASGPNDDILVDADSGALERSLHIDSQYQDHDAPLTPSSVGSEVINAVQLDRVNTFEKRSVVGPLGNLTGTPHGTGMQNTGSSIADNSSPGMKLSSMIARNSMRNEFAEYAGFYASPFPAVSSTTRMSPRRPPKPLDDRTPSEITLFPRENDGEPVQETPSPVENRRRPMRNSTTFHNSRRISRSAVPGQTKLRQMFLAGDGRDTMSSQGTNISRLMAGSRPSTSDTNTPLHPTHLNMEAFATRNVVAHESSPHLLYPEREHNAEDEAHRRKLSWLIFAMFCLLPPCIILFRWFGDRLMVSLTKGRLGHTTATSKRAALIAGVAVNVGLVTAILVPVMVWYAVKVV